MSSTGKDRGNCRRALLDHFSHLDPSGAPSLPPGAGPHRLHRRLPAPNTRVALGALLEILLIIANVGTAVVLVPVLKRQNEGLALGYVSARIRERGGTDPSCRLWLRSAGDQQQRS